MRKHNFHIYGTARLAAVLLAAAVLGTAPAASTHAATIAHSSKSAGTSSASWSTLQCLTTDMYTYDKMLSDANLLKQQYSGVTTDSVGTTADGRQILRISIGNRNAAKKILVTGTMHGREYITAPLLMRQAKDLLDRKAAGDTALNDVCVEFIPLVNPDGAAISQGALNGLRTQTMKDKVNAIINSWADWGLLTDQNKYDWYLNKWKNNANGVDINRNFPTPGWAPLSDLRDKPSSDLYKGPSAGSEAETKALISIVQQQKYTEVVNYHAQGQCIYWANSQANETVAGRNRIMAQAAKDDTGYTLVGQGGAGSDEGCSFKDWLDVQMQIPNITLEVGLGTSPVPETQIETIWGQNKNVLPDLIDELLGRKTVTIPAESGTAADSTASESGAADASGGTSTVQAAGTAGPGAAIQAAEAAENAAVQAAGAAENAAVQAAGAAEAAAAQAIGTVTGTSAPTAAGSGDVELVAPVPQ